MIPHLCAIVLAAASAVGDPSVLWDAEGATLRKLTNVSTGESRGEALFRLGEWERESATRLAQAEAADDVIAPHLDAADRAYSEAISVAAKERVPQLLFSLGDLRRSRGKPHEAAEPLQRLVKEYEKHPLAIDASLALGDDAFEAGKLADAMSRYEFGRTHAQSNGPKAYATYKLAWCRLNLEEYDKARALFRDVIQLATNSEGKSLSLADEARRDLVVALARDAGVTAKDAKAEIAKLVSGERARRYLGDYAKLIAGSGRDEEAAGLLQGLEEGAKPAEAVDLLSIELEIATRRRDLPALLRSAEKLADVVERGAPETDARESAERNLRVAAVTIHGEGRAAGDNARLETALALYRSYFRAFDNDPGAYELHHHAGELLLALRRPAEAERHYTAAVERDLVRLEKKEAPGKWLDASAHGAVEAAQDAMPPLKDDAPVASQTEEDVTAAAPAPTDLTAPEAVFVDACERYLKAMPQGADSTRIAYRRALVMYRHHRYEVAATAFQSLLADDKAPDVAPHAARLALDALRQLKKYDQVASLAAKLKKDASLANELGTELGTVQEAALLADAAREAAQGRPEVAASRYLAFADAFPHSPKLDTALYNGAAALTVQGRVAEAVQVRAKLLAAMPKSPLVPKARERQFTELVMLGRFSDAQKIAVVLAEDAKGAESAKWRREAVVLAEAAGDAGTADWLRRTAIEKQPHNAETFEHAKTLAEHARGCESAQQAWHKALSVSPDLAARTVALQRLARVEEKCRLKDLAEKHAGEAAWASKKLAKDKAEALDASADAALMLAGPVLEKYREVPLAEPYQRTIPKKLALLEAADKKLAGVIQRGRATAAACALVESGRAYAELAQELQKAKAPKGFGEEERELFTEQLAEKAQPLVDRARESLEQAITKAREASTRPVCLKDAVKVLAELAPDRYGPRMEAVLPLAPLPENPQVTAADILAKAPDAPAAWLLAAKAELAAGHAQAAIVLATRIAKDDPLAAEASEVVTLALRKTGPADLALSTLVKLAMDHPERPLALRLLAEDALAMRDDAGAKPWLDKLWDANPKDPAVNVDLAIALRATGDAANAEKLLRNVLKEKKDQPEASLALGALLCGEGAKPEEGAALLEGFQKSGAKPGDAGKFEATLAACRALAKGGKS